MTKGALLLQHNQLQREHQVTQDMLAEANKTIDMLRTENKQLRKQLDEQKDVISIDEFLKIIEETPPKATLN